MARVVVLFTTWIAFVHSFSDMLVQGRSDTLKVLRKIIREREAKVMPHDPFASPQMAWQASVSRDINSRRLHTAAGSERSRRDISRAVVESAQCDHIDLINCSDFESDEKTRELVDILDFVLHNKATSNIRKL
ncbi:hypothetical protein Q1695_005283 [Nippostrongylus brasiliensis]|nr:hypothetical protein Q1695_005283 [Nippostrongylus brasiliensis]